MKELENMTPEERLNRIEAKIREVNSLQDEIEALKAEIERKENERPKVDFSPLNNKDMFFIIYEGKRYLIGVKKEHPESLELRFSYSFFFDTFRKGEEFIKKGPITTLRKPTQEELTPLFNKHPELAPPKAGDWGIFWERNHPTTMSLCISYIDRLEAIWCRGYKKTKINASYPNFYKLDMMKPFKPQIDEFLKLHSK